MIFRVLPGVSIFPCLRTVVARASASADPLAVAVCDDDDAAAGVKTVRASEFPRSDRNSYDQSLADDVPRRFVLAHAYELRMPKVIVGGPLEELELRD
jgi:hypothetical protein